MKRDLPELFLKTLIVLLTQLPLLTISLANVAAVIPYNVIGKYPMLALCIFLSLAICRVFSKEQNSIKFSNLLLNKLGIDMLSKTTPPITKNKLGNEKPFYIIQL